MAYGSVNVPGASGQALEEVRGTANAALNRANTAYGAANAAAAQAAATAAGVSIQMSPGSSNSSDVWKNAAANYFSAIAIGSAAQAVSRHTIAIGADAQAGKGGTIFHDKAIAIGANAAAMHQYDVALGANALANGFSPGTGGSEHATAVGADACVTVGEGRVSAFYGTAVGGRAAALCRYASAFGSYANANGDYSTAVGYNAAASHNNAIAIGRNAAASGSDSLAIGPYGACASNFRSLALGCTANACGSYSIAIGYGSLATGEWSAALGMSTIASARESTAIGASAKSSSEFNLQLGNNWSLSSLTAKVNITVASDERDKTDIEEISDGAVEFLKRVKAIRFVYNGRGLYMPDDENLSEEDRKKRNRFGMCAYDQEAHAAGTKKGSRVRIGVSAQETQRALQEVYGSSSYVRLVDDNLYDFPPEEIPEDVESQLTLDYTGFVPFLIKAVQELDNRITALEKERAE